MPLPDLVKQLDRTQWLTSKIQIPNKPILTRYDLQNLQMPSGDFVTKSSGSTGIPVTVQRSNLSKLWCIATNIREAMWFQRDITLSLAVIRANINQEVSYDNWGPFFEGIGRTGPLYGHPVEGDLQTWLEKVNPHYLFTYPSILKTLDLSKLSKLRGIRTTGETLYDKLPLIADTYSAEEVGTIAIQCPNNSDNYHVMENMVVEIVDDQGRPNEIGRVIVTDLTSSYLHRYDIGDYAEIGSCTCGRGLQTLRRILGRKRNMVLLPDGSKHWPRMGALEFRNIAPIKRYQAVQITSDIIELRLITEGSLNAKQETALIKLVQKMLGHPFTINLLYLSEFPSGKFEEFINLII